MKNFILFCFLITGLQSCIARCAPNAMFFFPINKEISINSFFIIEGHGHDQETINSFKNRKVFLKNYSGEQIELKLREIIKGQKQVTQAIFYPIKILRPHTTYFLAYANQTKRESASMHRHNHSKGREERVFWKTTGVENTKIISPEFTIEFEKMKYNHSSCGPSINAIFNVRDLNKQVVWFKTELVELDSNKKMTYFLSITDKKLYVGHGMCSGAFSFERQGKYKVRFTPVNTDGKLLASTDWKIFENPYLTYQ